MEIRNFLLKDLEQVLKISQASFKEPWPKSEFEKYLEGSFVAENNSKIAGFVVGKISSKQGILKLIAVNPDFRGEGVGKNLMDYIFRYFSENSVKEVIARSRLHNKAGCAFLKIFGFKIIDTVKNYYSDGEDAYLMIKKLDS